MIVRRAFLILTLLILELGTSYNFLLGQTTSNKHLYQWADKNFNGHMAFNPESGVVTCVLKYIGEGSFKIHPQTWVSVFSGVSFLELREDGKYDVRGKHIDFGNWSYSNLYKPYPETMSPQEQWAEYHRREAVLSKPYDFSLDMEEYSESGPTVTLKSGEAYAVEVFLPQLTLWPVLKPEISEKSAFGIHSSVVIFGLDESGDPAEVGRLSLKPLDNKILMIDKQRYDQFTKRAEEMKKQE